MKNADGKRKGGVSMIILILGIIWLLYHFIKEASEPYQTGTFNYEKYNEMTKEKNEKERLKMLNSGMFHDNY